MSRRLLKTLIILAVTCHVRTQYIDFFQSFSSFIQPYQTTRRSEVVTKRTTAKPKPRYQDAIFFETDDFLKQKQNGGTVDPYTTTMKPKRKNKVTIKPSTKSPWYFDRERNNANSATTNFNNYNANSQTTKKNINNNDRRVDNDNNRRDNENIRRVDKDNNVYYDVTNNPAKNYRPTEKPIVYNHHFNVAQKPINSRPIYNTRTTVNPLLNRPGVRPAVVDDNRPPITNRPVTSYTERPNRAPENTEPEIDIGPDEDEMSEVERRRYIEIAEQKCDEYKSMNTKKIVALPLATLHASQGVELNVSTCTPINIPLIIGGKIVSIQEFPHMSLVGWKNIQKGGYSWKCGGTLISEQFILTAGHCTYHDKDYNVVSGPPQAVQLGSSYIDGRDSLVVSISSLIRHPKYKLRRSYYDVALIKLVTTVRFSDSISPACLGVPPAVGNRIIATGWGRTEFGGDSSPELRSVSVPIWDMGDCREVWGTSRKLPEGPSSTSQICAGERGGGKDTCQGDSGGPAQIQDGCTWRVVAVTSIGRSCGAAETPALYAKLPRAFIASQVFSNVKLSNRNNNNNGNNNRDNGNNNSDNRNNNGDRNNNWGNSNGANNGNNNWGVSDNRFNNQGSTDQNVVNRPGNHQTIGNNWSTSNQFGNTQSSTDVNRFGQVIGNHNNNGGIVNNNNNREEAVSRPGNHQVIDYNNRDTNTGSNYFITSQTSDNRDGVITRPGNHQTIVNDNNNRGNNYFVTSHTSNNNRETVSRPGNHQIINNDNNRGITANNYFVTSNTNGNNRDTVRLGNHQTVDSNRGTTLGTNYFVTSYTTNNRDSDIRPGNHQTINNNNNRFGDSQNSESSQDAVFDRPDRPSYNQNYNTNFANVNNNARPVINNEQNSYFNNQQNIRTTYSNYGTQNSEYGTTESVLYNRNNNAYNENNNRQYLVANRPWWSR